MRSGLAVVCGRRPFYPTVCAHTRSLFRQDLDLGWACSGPRDLRRIILLWLLSQNVSGDGCGWDMQTLLLDTRMQCIPVHSGFAMVFSFFSPERFHRILRPLQGVCACALGTTLYSRRVNIMELVVECSGVRTCAQFPKVAKFCHRARARCHCTSLAVPLCKMRPNPHLDAG